MNIGICDDEAAELESLSRLLADYGRQRQLSFDVDRFQSGEELLSAIGAGRSFEILFLDVYMGSMDGIAVAKKIRESDKACCIIFATNSNSRAIDGFGVRALHYLLKPIAASDVAAALDRAMESLPLRKDRCVQIQNRQGSHGIRLSDILFAESDARIVIIHTLSQGDVRYYDRLDNFELVCDDARFLRCHKSFLVNLDHVHAIVGNRVCLINGAELSVSMNIAKAKEIFASHTAKSI